MIFKFLLIEPSTPGNVGAAARAIKTMGFDQLCLVNPCEYLSGEAQWLAHGSIDILEKAEVYPSFDAAIEGLDFVIGTTAKQRSVKEDYLPLNGIKKILENKCNSIEKVGIIFGREDSGLRNEELKKCDLVSSIPLKTTYPSLNLAQSVMLYAYELSGLTSTNKPNTFNEQKSLAALKTKVEILLQHIGMKEESNIYPRILERLMFLGDTDVHLLHSICNKLDEKYTIYPKNK
ncbi:MAG: tRNA/rRNA methyltransferase [Prolixibacteraceae bacterium]|nr:tRNA/rRNA methyltransferase [Prolixibacteraceae bacterium]